MARRMKIPLGDFDDALNSLGFSGSEGNASVTDIDNQNTATQIIDDPDDDIKNLDNPDDNKPTEDNNNGDPNAKEDNSEIPDNILNNTKYTTKDFTTSTNLKITEKDKGYLEAYLEGQINKLEEARVGIKAGVKW